MATGIGPLKGAHRWAVNHTIADPLLAATKGPANTSNDGLVLVLCGTLSGRKANTK
jgi:hypothetical protein